MKKKIEVEIKNINISGTFVPICLEDALATLFEHKGISYKYVFAFAWDFIFAVDWIKTGKLGEAFLVDYFKKKIFKYLKKIYNIDIYPRKFQTVDEYKTYIEEEINSNNPIIAHADSYYLEWSALYKKQHSEHLVLLIGVEDNIYYVVDAIDSDRMFTLDRELFHSISKYIFEYNLMDISNIELIPKWSEEFYKELSLRENICPDIAFDNILEFAEYFDEKFDPKIEFDGYSDLEHLFNSVFMNSIRHILAGRNLFMIWLEDECKHDENDVIKEILKKMRESIKKWVTVQNILYKSATKDWKISYKDRVIKKVLEIKKIEREAYNLLEKLKCSQKEVIKRV